MLNCIEMAIFYQNPYLNLWITFIFTHEIVYCMYLVYGNGCFNNHSLIGSAIVLSQILIHSHIYNYEY